MNGNRKAVMAKIESPAGTDSAPAGATDAFQAVNFAWNGPAKAVTDQLKYASEWYGARDDFVVSMTRECSFELPVVGGGMPLGTNLPAPLLAIMRACGHAAVVSAGVSVTFSPVNSGEESATLRITDDTFLRKMLMARGNIKWGFAEGKVGRWYATMMGLYSTPADEAIPAQTLPALQKPVGYSKSNSIVTLGGYALKCAAFTLDGGRTFEYRNYAGVEDIAPVDCLPTAELMFELPRVDQKSVYQELETTSRRR
jgi:hypothetical protein